MIAVSLDNDEPTGIEADVVNTFSDQPLADLAGNIDCRVSRVIFLMVELGFS